MLYNAGFKKVASDLFSLTLFSNGGMKGEMPKYPGRSKSLPTCRTSVYRVPI